MSAWKQQKSRAFTGPIVAFVAIAFGVFFGLGGADSIDDAEAGKDDGDAEASTGALWTTASLEMRDHIPSGAMVRWWMASQTIEPNEPEPAAACTADEQLRQSHADFAKAVAQSAESALGSAQDASLHLSNKNYGDAVRELHDAQSSLAELLAATEESTTIALPAASEMNGRAPKQTDKDFEL